MPQQQKNGIFYSKKSVGREEIFHLYKLERQTERKRGWNLKGSTIDWVNREIEREN